MARSLAYLVALVLAVVLLAASPAQAFDDRLDFTFPKALGNSKEACLKVRHYCAKFVKLQPKGYKIDNVCQYDKETPKVIKVVCESYKGEGKMRDVKTHIGSVQKHFHLVRAD